MKAIDRLRLGSSASEQPYHSLCNSIAGTRARGTSTSVYFRDPDGSLLEFFSYEEAVEI
jgi:catechol 2,3-dioxygenase-like lactoylglutathione lyase family enzyme